MDNVLENIDHAIVLTINSWHNPVLDEIMWVLSLKSPWIPLYVFLVYLAYKKLAIKQLAFFICIAFLTVIFSDLISNYCFKDVFMRYRPSHNLLLEGKLHFYENKPGEHYKGGTFGFVSSHAADFFAFSVFIGLSLKPFYPKLIYVLLLISILVSLSRVYLGVHYLSDIFVGGLLGSFIAFLGYKFIYLRFIHKFKKSDLKN